MARLSSTSRRPFGRRLRSVAVAALIVGATGAFFPGGHSAHAASMSPQLPCTGTGNTVVNPAPINGSIGVTINGIGVPNSGGTGITGGSLIVNVDGAGGNVTFNGLNALASGGSFDQVCLNDNIPGGTATGGTGLQFNGNGVSGTCSASDVTAVKLTVLDAFGDDQIGVVCNVPNVGIAAITFIATAPGSHVTPTPELGSGELLATGLVPALGIILYRRRRQRRASK